MAVRVCPRLPEQRGNTMAIKTLFSSIRGPLLPRADAVNYEGAPAYAYSAKHALAQYAATGCFGRTFYTTEEEQLARVLELCRTLEPQFVAQTAIYARQHSYLKDVPALLCAWLSKAEPRLHEAVFGKVIDTAKMLRTYVQILRSGVVGRKSLGTAPKRLVRDWLAARGEDALFRASVGANPSMRDVLKLAHPKPESGRREAFYGYLLGRSFDAAALPRLVIQFERFKAGAELAPPDLPFQMLSALPLSRKDWAAIARNASWQTVRMNLNAFARHGVFEEPGMAGTIASQLKDAGEIARARVFPYQLMSAYQNCDSAVPRVVRDALQDAMETATANVPAITGKVVLCPDVSGSMTSPVTGYRRGSTTAVRCVEVAALVTAVVLRKNPQAEVLPFAEAVRPVDLNPRDSLMTNAAKLAAACRGGTNCSAPVRLLNQRRSQADVVVFVSDNQSWVDQGRGRGTALLAEWQQLRTRNPQARLVCLDLQPNETTQAVEREDILNIGGFSDQVFEVVSAFASGRLNPDHWVGRIEAIPL
jgi:60 kDa SS-A/Ro ribonucleoprotein